MEAFSDQKTLSIVIPVFNEREHISHVLNEIEEVVLPVKKEVIIVDDYSTDGTREYLKEIQDTCSYSIIFKTQNEGKGAALREGFKHITGDIVIIQDADLEYKIEDYPNLIQPILEDESDVVLGSRLIDLTRFSSPYLFHVINNRLITFVSNLFTGLGLTDMETCYKVMKREVIESFKDDLYMNDFGIEPELMRHISRLNWKVKEVPIFYTARTFQEGKKITIRDGFLGVFHILGFQFKVHKKIHNSFNTPK